jgi:hypothetical protein
VVLNPTRFCHSWEEGRYNAWPLGSVFSRDSCRLVHNQYGYVCFAGFDSQSQLVLQGPLPGVEHISAQLRVDVHATGTPGISKKPQSRLGVPALKRSIIVETFSRSAEALLPPHSAGAPTTLNYFALLHSKQCQHQRFLAPGAVFLGRVIAM